MAHRKVKQRDEKNVRDSGIDLEQIEYNFLTQNLLLQQRRFRFCAWRDSRGGELLRKCLQ